MRSSVMTRYVPSKATFRKKNNHLFMQVDVRLDFVGNITSGGIVLGYKHIYGTELKVTCIFSEKLRNFIDGKD